MVLDVVLKVREFGGTEAAASLAALTEHGPVGASGLRSADAGTIHTTAAVKSRGGECASVLDVRVSAAILVVNPYAMRRVASITMSFTT